MAERKITNVNSPSPSPVRSRSPMSQTPNPQVEELDQYLNLSTNRSRPLSTPPIARRTEESSSPFNNPSVSPSPAPIPPLAKSLAERLGQDPADQIIHKLGDVFLAGVENYRQNRPRPAYRCSSQPAAGNENTEMPLQNLPIFRAHNETGSFFDPDRLKSCISAAINDTGLPAVKVDFDAKTGKPWLADGFHRAFASVVLGYPKIPVEQSIEAAKTAAETVAQRANEFEKLRAEASLSPETPKWVPRSQRKNP